MMEECESKRALNLKVNYKKMLFAMIFIIIVTIGKNFLLVSSHPKIKKKHLNTLSLKFQSLTPLNLAIICHG